jgi:dihydroxyacetone kinase
MVVKNYTGDVLQFGLARERWSATGRNSVRMVVVGALLSSCALSPHRTHLTRLYSGDDVSVPRSQGVLTGRRGLAATVLVYKVAGALAATGASLDEVEHVANIIANNSATFGIGLEHCHVPGTEEGEAYLKNDEVEIGMGQL